MFSEFSGCLMLRCHGFNFSLFNCFFPSQQATFRHPENVSNQRAPRIVDRCDILHVTTIPKTSSERKNFQSPILGNVNGHPWV